MTNSSVVCQSCGVKAGGGADHCPGGAYRSRKTIVGYEAASFGFVHLESADSSRLGQLHAHRHGLSGPRNFLQSGARRAM